ncbi:tRNA 4-thiouridine(8) synthase ThiI [Methanomassiliicoccus luminyensis]|uniref:tRNA 4-thiouridine(8) synthase ThiI n=1 Tax=Methanomassiliicoccus luminyensis TaxID=1080712 RepID=UPI000377449E|nr:tRNA 4-thiouridine(8) synthase ThiI [Methanomassiliicoccus luminyensis]
MVCLLSGGIDSPVAADLIGRNGAEVVLLHMDNRPYSDNAVIDKVQKLAGQLARGLGRDVPLYVAPHGYDQLMISRHCRRELQCVLCKRTMLKVARNVARDLGADAVVTGESLGQVASQTLHNLAAEENGLGFPVLRPLIGLDKLEIENIAKRIGTYDISIQKSMPCSAVPFHPATMATVEMIRVQEGNLDLEKLAEEAAEEAFLLSSTSSSGT